MKCRKSWQHLSRGWSFPPVFEDNSIAGTDRSMESIRFETSTPSSGSDSIVDTSVIIFASLSLRKLVAVLINVLHNSPISCREYFQYEYRVRLHFRLLAVTFSSFSLFLSHQSTKKGGRRAGGVCVCVCVLSPASYKFNLKNLVLNYALADGIFHREIDFTQSFPVSLLEPPLLSPILPPHPSFLNFEIPRKFPSRKATYWHSFFRNDRHRARRCHQKFQPDGNFQPDLTNKRFLVLSSCNYFGSIASETFPFRLDLN